MVRVSGGRDPLRFGAIPPVDDFWIDRFEVTNRAFKAFVDAGGYRDRSHWREPLLDNGREVSWTPRWRGSAIAADILDQPHGRTARTRKGRRTSLSPA